MFNLIAKSSLVTVALFLASASFAREAIISSYELKSTAVDASIDSIEISISGTIPASSGSCGNEIAGLKLLEQNDQTLITPYLEGRLGFGGACAILADIVIEIPFQEHFVIEKTKLDSTFLKNVLLKGQHIALGELLQSR